MAETSRSGDPQFSLALTRASEVLQSAVPDGGPVPVDLHAALQAFGVGEPIIEVRPGRHGALRRVDERWHPVVYRKDPSANELSPRERFTVAHELGHAIIDGSLRLRPARRAQYWALETVCDSFAGDLLIPSTEVKGARAVLRDAQSTLATIQRLASITDTSLAASARRLLDGLPALSAWGVRRIPNASRDQAQWKVAWTAGGRRYGLGVGSHIGVENPLYVAITSGPCYVGAREEVTIGTGRAALVQLSRGFSLIAWWESQEAAPSSRAAQLALSL